MQNALHTLGLAWLSSIALAGCTPAEPMAGLVTNPNSLDPSGFDTLAPDVDATESVAGDGGPQQDGADSGSGGADIFDAKVDATGADVSPIDVSKPDITSAPDMPVFDAVPGFDQAAPHDLGQRYDPDIWQEFPQALDADGQLGADALPDANADASADTIADGTDATVQDAAPADAVAEVAGDVAADAQPEVIADADADASGDTQPEALTDAPEDMAQDGPADASLDSAPDGIAEVVADADVGATCTAKACDDGEPCTMDSCSPSGKCMHAVYPTGTECSGGKCQQGFCSRNAPASAGASCQQLKLADPQSPTGVWWLDPDGPIGVWQPYPVWCDMVAEGGGWTLLLKVAEEGKLGYDSPLWTSITTLNPEHPRLDEWEGKFESYWSVPHNELRIGMHVGNQVAWLVLPLQASSLFHLIKDDKPIPTALPAAKWLGLLPSTKLQNGCLMQGLNINPGNSKQAQYNYARVRIGLVGNTEADCQTPDSRIGLGGAGGTCGQDPTITCGNAAGCFEGALVSNQPAIGYVLAR